jgi:hypothetical protein
LISTNKLPITRTSFLARFSSVVSSGSFGAVLSVVLAFAVDFFGFDFADLVEDSFAVFGV